MKSSQGKHIVVDTSIRTFHTLWRRSTGGVSTNPICPNCLGGCYNSSEAERKSQGVFSG